MPADVRIGVFALVPARSTRVLVCADVQADAEDNTPVRNRLQVVCESGTTNSIAGQNYRRCRL